jgi:poly-gamma-glutamate synthesis protein (capsule biosynthesis protein)
MTFLKKHALTILSVPLVSALMVAVFLIFPTSEYVEVLVAGAEPEKEQTATLLFVGDIMLDRYIRTVTNRNGASYVLAEVRTLIEGADIAAGNLEGPITDSASVSGGTKVGDANNMRFTFPPTSASMLSSFGFDLVSIANNHMRDFGTGGVESTKRHLAAAGIRHIGDPNGAATDPVVEEVNGIRIAFVPYNEFLGWDKELTLQGVRDANRDHVDVVVVMAHWGDEYETEPPERVRVLLAELKDAGTDLVIGTHPHVIGTREDQGAMRVYYSLGNFVFDQYWNPEVRCGLVVTVTAIKKRGDTQLVYDETKVGMERDGRTVLGCS